MFFIECVLGTHDVQSIGVSSAAPNTVSLSASFSEISAAEGVMFVLLFTEESGSVSFTDSVYLVLNRAQSNQFMQANITQGQYTVLAFDVEGNGKLEPRQSSAAAEESIRVSGQGQST